MSQDAQTALAQLSDDALQTLILDLGRYALSVSRRLYWRTGNAIDLPRGETVDSIVSKAFTKVLTGERRWDLIKMPDLKKYLMGVIDSLLNHLAEHKDNTTLRPLPRLEDGGDAPLDAAQHTMPGQQPLRDPEAVLLQQETANHQAQVLQHLFDSAQDDPLVLQILEAMQAGHGKPGDIAGVLDLPVSEIYKALKRLDRKLIRVRQNTQPLL